MKSISIIFLLLSAVSLFPFEYYDGIGNTYSLSKNKLKYIPLPAKLSSTGFYDGGDPKEISLSPPDVKKIEEAFQKAAKAPEAERESNRVKGSGVVVIQKKQILLKGNSDSKRDLEKLLRGYLNL